jgi:hypothetical protein
MSLPYYDNEIYLQLKKVLSHLISLKPGTTLLSSRLIISTIESHPSSYPKLFQVLSNREEGIKRRKITELMKLLSFGMYNSPRRGFRPSNRVFIVHQEDLE